MNSLPRTLVASFAVALLLHASAKASPVINELMFHPPGVPENQAQEWIELHNNSGGAVDVSGWTFTEGVAFTIPAGTTIAAGGYLVVAANVAAFQAAHPGFAGALVGGWTGRLSNSGEDVRLETPEGALIDEVNYADNGDWATRARGALSFGRRGWDWDSPADGGGKTLELRNANLSFADSGQNWGPSTPVGGTPGATNSLASTDIAPLISDVKHRPEVPRSTDPIVISADFLDDAGSVTATTLHWRVDAGVWQTAPMTDTDGDSDREATILPKPNLTVLEYYISASDGVNTRTWPAAARNSNPGVTPATFAQAANALVQVDNSFDPNIDFTVPGNQPIYRLTMLEAERAELQLIGDDYAGKPVNEEDSLARMNATFVSHDGTGIETVYLAGVRNRGGADTSSGPPGSPNNYNVSFPSDDLWNDRSSFQLNGYYPFSQVLGNSVFDRAGIPPQEAAIVRVRVNGANLAPTGAQAYGRYARLEGRSGEWAERHFPNDSEGNFYRLDDHATNPVGNPPGDLGSGEFRYEGTNPLAYADTFIKETNQDDNDYSDLIEFARVVSAPQTGGTAEQPAIPDSAYVAAVSARLDLDQFYRFIAVDALVGNREGGLQSGRGDDVSIYRGVSDPRFRFIPHDLDDVFFIGQGLGADPEIRSIFSYDGQNPSFNANPIAGMRRLFNHPELVPRYYAAVLDVLNTTFTHAKLDPVIDQIMGGWAAAGTIATAKNFIDLRRTNVLGQIQQNYSFNVTTGVANTPEGYLRTNTGAATISGTFNVAETYSITVNGQLAQWFYRPAGTDAAGTWKMLVPAGGGSVLRPGLNKLVVNFHAQPNGAGQVLQTYSADVFFAPSATTAVSGTLSAPGSLAMIAPATYLPGVPVLVRVDLKDLAGNLDRAAWNRTANLTATNGVTLTPNTVALTNGMGSALVTIGGGGGAGSVQTLIARGTSWRYKDDGSDQGTAWRASAFNDSTWLQGLAELGRGDGGEATPLAPQPTGSHITYYFRKTFTVADPAAFVSARINMRFDDGAIVYVNGQRAAISAGVTPDMAFNVNSSVGRSGPTEDAYDQFAIPLNLLQAGTNTIAVEVHQAAASTDVSFDLDFEGVTPASDPGNFTLTANVGAISANKALASLGSAPAMTNVAGTLPGSTTWSGVINMTGDVTVPAGATLTINPGTHILVAGSVGAGTQGSDLIVNGAVAANGTLAQPISMTSNAIAARWGEINHTTATPSTYNFCLITRAAHSPGGGHTGTGPIIRLAGTTITFNDCVLSDSPGKTMMNSGNCNITIRRTQFARGVMGPELDGSALLIEDSNLTDMLAIYRESGAQDDEDCIYILDSGGRPVNIRRTVFGTCDDDAFDCLAGTINTVEDCIIRNAFDKGASLLDNNVTFRRTLIIDNDIGISGKSRDATPRTITLENCTIVGEEHLGNTGDGEAHSVGVHARNKPGQGSANAVILFNLKNCIIVAHEPFKHDAPYPATNTTATYGLSLDDNTPGAPAWPGVGNLAVDPQFVNLAGKDFHLTPGSPARNSGDPASPLDADGSRADMGAYPFGAATSGGGEVRWTLAGSPYHVTANTTVPGNLTLRIDPGVSVFFSQNARLTVNGRLLAEGTPGARIVFSHVPGANAPGDADPIKFGTQTGPAKWGGIRVVDSMAQENVVRYADFINAQGTDPATEENFGSLGFIRSWGWGDHLTFAGTHLRMLYGRNCKLTVTHCVFPNMFIFDPTLSPPDNPPIPGRIENPIDDFIASADNRMEPLKVEFPTTDPEVLGANAVNFPNGLPRNGHWRVWYNQFNGNRGHQDVFDGDSGRWAPRDASNNQTNGEFMLDCRYNHFRGLAGDEHIDLGGDAYIASNIFENARKDFWTNDTGYSNAISSGDKGTGTTIMVARNVCYDLDHVINLKANTATIFEHNTVANLHADFQFVGATVTQNVVCAPVNFFIPGDGGAPTRGDGAYMGFNIVSNVPHMFSGPDASASGPVTTKIEFFHNLLDQIVDPVIGPNHPGGFFSGTYGPNRAGAPDFIDPAVPAENYGLKPGSRADGRAPGGLDYGATIPEWAYVVGGPASVTNATSASFTIGGPGVVAYKWRLNGGAWSAPVQIGAGGVLPRGATPTMRQATLNLSGLANGPQTLEVLGQDMAGNWQDADGARTIEGLAQAAPTARTWTVNTALPAIQINEILADTATAQPDAIELRNNGASAVNAGGLGLTDDPLIPHKYTIPADTFIPAGGFLTITSAVSGIALDKDGDAAYLFSGATLVDSIAFGAQLPDLTLGRDPATNAWTLCTNDGTLGAVGTFGAANVTARLGDPLAVRINEWFADGDVLYADDWIELVNPGALPVDVAGLRITDNRIGNPNVHIFPAHTFIAANGFLRLSADKEPETGPGHLDFRLDAQQESIALLDATGAELDAIFFEPQTTDRSMGRDANGNLVFYELPTRGIANGTSDPGYANALALLRGLRITELMFNAIGGNDYDYVELRNVGPTPLALGGVSFVEGIEFTFPAMTLAPGGNVLVVASIAKFVSRYGSSPTVAGAYTGRLDNGGEDLGLQLSPPFDANVMTFEYQDDWYAVTDGFGPSLVVPNPLVKAGEFGDRNTWAVSAVNGGDPGGLLALSTTYSGWSALHAAPSVTSDGDFDGVAALVEFGLGMSNENPNAGDGQPGLPAFTRTPDGRAQLTFLVPANAPATQGHGFADIIYNVQAADALGTWTTIATKPFGGAWTGNVAVGAPGGGFVPITVTDATAPGSAQRFLRLQINWLP